MPWIFSSFRVTPRALTSCHFVISKQDSTIWALGYNRCVIGCRPRDENHAGRFRQSEENHSQLRDTQPIRGVSDELVRGFKPWHPLASGRRYGRRSSLSLSEYISLNPSLTHHRNINPFEHKV